MSCICHLRHGLPYTDATTAWCASSRICRPTADWIPAQPLRNASLVQPSSCEASPFDWQELCWAHLLPCRGDPAPWLLWLQPAAHASQTHGTVQHRNQTGGGKLMAPREPRPWRCEHHADWGKEAGAGASSSPAWCRTDTAERGQSAAFPSISQALPMLRCIWQ